MGFTWERRPFEPFVSPLLSRPTTPELTAPQYTSKHSSKSDTMTMFASTFRWLQRKRYQYEVTFSLYMLTPTEKFIFNSFLFLCRGRDTSMKLHSRCTC